MEEQSTKTALITGASRGIGKAIATALVREGYQVINADVLVPEEPEEGIHFIEADVSSSDDRRKIIEFCQSKSDSLDLLVNNAAISVEKRGDMLDTEEASFDRLMAVNLKGPYFLTQLAAKWMIKKMNPDNEEYRPKVINMASLTSYVSAAFMAEYGLTKAGLSMMTILYADRLSKHGINVYEIRPGIIKTTMTAPSVEKYNAFIEGRGLPIMRWGLPEDVAKAVIAIATDLLPYSTGEVINVDGGYHLRRL